MGGRKLQLNPELLASGVGLSGADWPLGGTRRAILTVTLVWWSHVEASEFWVVKRDGVNARSSRGGLSLVEPSAVSAVHSERS